MDANRNFADAALNAMSSRSICAIKEQSAKLWTCMPAPSSSPLPQDARTRLAHGPYDGPSKAEENSSATHEPIDGCDALLQARTARALVFALHGLVVGQVN